MGIYDFNGASFWFAVYAVPSGKMLNEGSAVLYPDNSLMAKDREVSFSLHEDFSTIDISVSDSSAGSEYSLL